MPKHKQNPVMTEMEESPIGDAMERQGKATGLPESLCRIHEKCKDAKLAYVRNGILHGKMLVSGQFAFWMGFDIGSLVFSNRSVTEGCLKLNLKLNCPAQLPFCPREPHPRSVSTAVRHGPEAQFWNL